MMLQLSLINKIVPWTIAILVVTYAIFFQGSSQPEPTPMPTSTSKVTAHKSGNLIATPAPAFQVIVQEEIPECGIFVPENRNAYIELAKDSPYVIASSGDYQADARFDDWYRIHVGNYIGWVNRVIPTYNCAHLPVIRSLPATFEYQSNLYAEQALYTYAAYDPDSYFLPIRKDMNGEFSGEISSPDGDSQDTLIISLDYLQLWEMRDYELQLYCEANDISQVTAEVQNIASLACNQSVRLNFSYDTSKIKITLFAHSHNQQLVNYKLILLPIAALDDDNFLVEVNRYQGTNFANTVAVQDDLEDSIIAYTTDVDQEVTLYELTLQCNGPDTSKLTWSITSDTTRNYLCNDRIAIVLNRQQPTIAIRVTSQTYVNYLLSIWPRAMPTPNEPMSISIDFEYGANRSGALPSIESSNVVYFLSIANFPAYLDQPVTFYIHLDCKGEDEYVRWTLWSNGEVYQCQDTVAVNFRNSSEEIPLLISFPKEQKSLASFHLSVYRPQPTTSTSIQK